jgi:hypothetical protein
MKKYLIKGVLALFAGAFLFSCAETETEYVPLAQQKVKAFDEVFKEVFGDNIDPYQDWGFNSAALKLDPNDSSMVMEVIDISDGEENTLAGARAFAGTRAIVNVNGNQWRSRPSLGETEEADVLKYMDMTLAEMDQKGHNYYKEVPRNLVNYFVTQVHTGDDYYGTAQNPNNKTVLGSSKMNNLHIAMTSSAARKNGTIKGDLPDSTNWEHVNNFNAATSKDWGGNTMFIDSGTFDFAYHNSDDSKYHNRWIIVKGSDIDASKYGNYYYVCFDFEGVPNESKSYYSFNYVDANGVTQSANGEIDGYYETLQDIKDAGIRTIRDYANNDHSVNAVTNFTISRWGQDNMLFRGDNNYSDWIIRLVEASKKVPSDVPDTTVVEYWIPLEAGRVFCEDLGRASREDLDYNDLVFDARTWRYEKWNIIWNKHYNDSEDTNPASISKKDSALTETKFYADIKLLAAGGTIPITILNKRQVHSLFKKPADIATMINTRDNNSNVYGSFDVRSAIEVGDSVHGDVKKTFKTKDGGSFTLWLIPGYEHIKDIPIVSSFDGAQVTELNANQGQAPHKILVEYGKTKWVSERKNLALAYPNFSKYVTGEINKTGWVKEGINTDYLYDQPVENEYSPAPTIIKSTKEIVGDAELEIWSGTQAFGSNWNYASTSSGLDYYSNKEFFPGDRIRFHGTVTAKGDADQPYITVTFFDDSKPYLVDTQFAERKKKIENGKEVWYYPSTAYVEVLLDGYFCSKLNKSVNPAGQLTLHVQGRGFTLTKIGYVPFK